MEEGRNEGIVQIEPQGRKGGSQEWKKEGRKEVRKGGSEGGMK